MRELEQFSMRLIPNILTMESDTVLTQYIISSWSLDYRNDGNYHFLTKTARKCCSDDPSAGVALQLVFKRRIINELLTTYLPRALSLKLYHVSIRDPRFMGPRGVQTIVFFG